MTTSKTLLGFFCVFSAIAFSCNHQKNNNTLPEKETPITVNKQTETLDKDTVVAPITYHYLPLDSILITQLKDKFSTQNLQLLLVLNRIDFEHVWKADTLIVPDSFVIDTARYSPYPLSLPIISGINKLLLFSYYSQMFAAYEHGNLVRWGPTSMGKRTTPTPPNLYFTNWKAKQTTSTDNADWKLYWYFNLDNVRGVSLHQYDLPGFPASHACMRLYEEDAHWFYDWAEQWILIDNNNIAAYGTPVIIFGTYPFGKQKPWYQLPKNNTATHLTETELNEEINKFLPLIEQRQTQRDSVLAIKQNQSL